MGSRWIKDLKTRVGRECWISIGALHQSTAALTWWCGPRPRLGWVVLPPETPKKGSMPLLQNWLPVFSLLLLLSCPSSSSHSSPSHDERQRSS